MEEQKVRKSKNIDVIRASLPKTEISVFLMVNNTKGTLYQTGTMIVDGRNRPRSYYFGRIRRDGEGRDD